MTKHDTLLICGATVQTRQILRGTLEESFNLLEAGSPRQAMMLLNQNRDCIAALLVDTACGNAEALLNLIRQDPAGSGQIPVIAISMDNDSETLTRAFESGAADVIPLNYDSYGMLKRIRNITELSLHKRDLEELVREQADILRHSNDLMVDALSSIIEYRSTESGQHILRIRHFTRILLEEVARGCPEYDLTDQDIRIISSASALHDIGKIAIPDAILTKPGKLTQEERAVMQEHTRTGCEILRRLGDMGNAEYLRYAHNICHYHHERWDGGGYPEGLSGDAIPICAQVVGLADVYDALTSKRVYKDALPCVRAAHMILRGECGVFSPKLLECFRNVMPAFENLARAYADGLSPQAEVFDTALPQPEGQQENSLERLWAKYYALLHYIGGLLMEIDLNRQQFHLIYNPYPELAWMQDVTTFSEMNQQLVERHASWNGRHDTMAIFQEYTNTFLEEDLRRSTRQTRFASRQNPEGKPYEVTMLRIHTADPTRRTLAVLCRKLAPEEVRPEAGQLPDTLSDSTFVCRYDPDFTLVRLGSQIPLLAGYAPGELEALFDNRLIRLVLPQDREAMRETFRTQLRAGTAVEAEFRVRHKKGHILWVLDKCRLVIGPDGREYLHSMLTDITRSREALDRMTEKMERYEIILAQTENVLFEWDMETDRMTFSDTWETIFGANPVSDSVRKQLLEGSVFHPDDLPLLLDRLRLLEEGSHYEMTEVRIAASGGRYLWCRVRASALRDEAGQLKKISGIIINIDAEKQEQRALRDRAERDALTKLLNKQSGHRHTEEYLSQFPQGVACALLIIDLDNFKQVNDRYGHLFGDAVLTRIAREIRRLFRSQDILSRIGGDEFMVLMRGVSDRALVENRCSRLLDTVRNAFREQGQDFPLGCSIGIALAPDHGRDYYTLFRHADQALYQAKAKGRNTYMFYDSADDRFRTSLQRTAVANNRIDSDEQPGLADNSLVQYAFRRLYGAKDVDAAVNEILRLAGELMKVSRVYVFENSDDNRYCSNTYEWCGEGIEPEIQNLQHISYEEDIPGYRESYDESGIVYSSDIADLPPAVYDILAPQGIKALLHCAIREGGIFRGYIGFDDCVTHRLWTRDQIDALTYLSEMLSVFLLKKRAQDKTAQRATELSSILDNQNAWIYIIDPDTCRLKYVNAKTRTLAPEVSEGMRCHQALMGLPERCPGCPSADIRSQGTCSALLRNEKFGLQVLAEATLIQWEGAESCLLTCREAVGVQNLPRNPSGSGKCNAE